jgi:hypothetical protein
MIHGRARLEISRHGYIGYPPPHGTNRLDRVKKNDPAYLEVRPMAYPEALHLLIRGKLKSGALPRNDLRRVSGGPGNGESCVACSEIIAKTQVAVEGISEHLMVLRFHVTCFSLWNAERKIGARVESGA